MAVTSSYEQIQEIQYDAVIHKALGNENKNYLRDSKRRTNRQALFSELDDSFVAGFTDTHAQDSFDGIGFELRVLNFPVTVRNAYLHNALTQLDDVKRNIILMAFWLDMNDREIADEIGKARSTVNEIRNDTYAKLRQILEADGYAEGNNIHGE